MVLEGKVAVEVLAGGVPAAEAQVVDGSFRPRIVLNWRYGDSGLY